MRKNCVGIRRERIGRHNKTKESRRREIHTAGYKHGAGSV
nr:MAG TPA: hypothetical protein [Caudoviricetes sp.]